MEAVVSNIESMARMESSAPVVGSGLEKHAGSLDVGSSATNPVENMGALKIFGAKDTQGGGCGDGIGSVRADVVVSPSLLFNRVLPVAWHIPYFGFKTQARLARDSGVSPAAVSRLIRGHTHPTLPIALRVTAALSRRLGRPLDLAEVFSVDGTFPTESVCCLCNCPNCLPPNAYDEDGNLKPAFRETKAGHWAQSTLHRQGGR